MALVEVFADRRVAIVAVSCNGDNVILRAQSKIFGRLDGADDVAYAAGAKLAAQCLCFSTADPEPVDQRIRPRLDHFHPLHGLLIVDEHQQIGVVNVMDERNHLVADAFDTVLALAAVEEGRALSRFKRYRSGVGVE